VAKGFGTPPSGKPRKKQPTPQQQRRQQAASKFEEMQQQGLPEFQIFIRIPGRDWVPAGTMAVERSSQIAAAIFQHEADLRKGTYRLYPVLRQFQDTLEYGYRLKEFADEEVTLAVRPPERRPWFRQVGQTISGWFAKS
jgi:hypothetical protein